MAKGEVQRHKRFGDKKFKPVKKNISKKDADRQRRVKLANRIEKVKERKTLKEKEMQLKKGSKLKEVQKAKKQKEKDEEEWEDVDEHEKDAFDKDGYFDIPEAATEISGNDEKLLKMMQMKKEETGKAKSKENESVNLADIIMQKLQNGQFQDGNNMKEVKYEDLEEGVSSNLDPKVVAAYKSIGQLLRTYKSGKLPKAFKIIPQVANWEELLFLTKPESWSPCAVAEATKIFCSNLNSKLTQRFYNLVLLPSVRENISTYKKLNYHLYMALKKALFKPAAFFKGFLLPLTEDATSREAIIVGSILAKVSIPILHASAALIKLTEFDYQIGSGYFIKVLLSKRYALPTKALDILIDFFCKFGVPDEDEDKVPEMPVMWHQSLLAFVSAYKYYLTEEHRNKLKALFKVQQHYLITPETRKELFSFGVGQKVGEAMEMD